MPFFHWHSFFKSCSQVGEVLYNFEKYIFFPIQIPGVSDPTKTVYEEMMEFQESYYAPEVEKPV